MVSTASEPRRRGWLVAAAVAVILGALWLRTWNQPYLISASAAIAVCFVLGARDHRSTAWMATAAALATLGALGWRAQSAFREINHDWSRLERLRVDEGGRVFADDLRDDFGRLERAARAALDVPAGPT